MTILESFLLALALCVDTLAVSTACGLKYKLSRWRWVLLSLTLAVAQGLFPLSGALIGSVCEQFIRAIDHWVAFALLLAIGVKMIADAFRKKDDSDLKANTLNFGAMCLLGVATSIDAFAVGIGFGLNCTILQSVVTCGIITLVTFIVSVVGTTLGRAGRQIPERWASVIAGLVLIGIGVKILVEHLCKL
ncbi:MAG: manganese efflux pump [Bacteroidales bacterium]|nr:manganese efflux pump [Bacteroidales bacterium]